MTGTLFPRLITVRLVLEKGDTGILAAEDPVEFGHLLLDRGNPILDETDQLDFRVSRVRILLHEKAVGCQVHLRKGFRQPP